METQYYYKRFKKTNLYHFTPANGYGCPVFKGEPDYEVVKIVKAPNGSTLLNRRVLIAWGKLDLPTTDRTVFAKDVDGLVADLGRVIAVSV